MIPKLICWIFGHKRTWNSFTGEYGKVFDRVSGEQIDVPVYVEKKYDSCPRCGAKLEVTHG